MRTERRVEQLLDVHVDDGKSLWPLSAVSDVRHQAFQCLTSVASSGGENTMFGHDVGLEGVLVEKYSTMLRKKKGHAGPALEEWICAGGAPLE